MNCLYRKAYDVPLLFYVSILRDNLITKISFSLYFSRCLPSIWRLWQDQSSSCPAWMISCMSRTETSTGQRCWSGCRSSHRNKTSPRQSCTLCSASPLSPARRRRNINISITSWRTSWDHRHHTCSGPGCSSHSVSVSAGNHLSCSLFPAAVSGSTSLFSWHWAVLAVTTMAEVHF